MKRLAAYAALLAVPTMIAGIYGMNFEHMPELKWRYGYALVMAVMAALDSDFVDEVTDGMRPGMTAIVVEADEGSTRAIDDIVSLAGGHVYRQAA